MDGGCMHSPFEFDINKTCNLEKKVENMGKVCFESKMLHVKAKPLQPGGSSTIPSGGRGV